MKVLPEHDKKITQRTIGGGHRYQVPGVRCGSCYQCVPKIRKDGKIRKQGTCIGLPSVTSISGKYADGDMYGIGYRAAFNSIFGNYTDATKSELKPDGMLLGFTDDTVLGDINDLLWLRQQAEQVKSSSQKGLATGTEVHRILDEWLTAKKDGDDPFVQAEKSHIDQARKIVEWLDMHECEIEEAEVSVYHPELLYGGQVDCIARRGNSVLLLDWKSGRGIYNSYAAQLGGYVMAYEAMTGERVSEAWVLRSDVDGNFEAKQVADIEVAKMLFRNLQACKETFEQIAWEG